MDDNNQPIVMCIKSGQGECCIAGDCPLFQGCFLEAYEDWKKAVAKENKGEANVRT